MEFLLINHPLDCPVCDKGGECPLQNQAMTNGRGETRFATAGQATFPKPINISAQVLLDRERCVLCARCTRFSEQIAGDPFIALIERGALQQVGIYEKEPFESYFSGNTIQICPVGALTSADVPLPLPAVRPGLDAVDRRARRVRLGDPGRPPARQGDAPAGRRRPRGQRGVDHRQGPVRVPLRAPDDRLTHPHGPRRRDRRAAARVLAGGVRRRRPRPRRGRRRLGVLTGGRLTAEDAYAYSKFARVALGTNDIDFRSRPHSAEEADFLGRRGRRAPARVVTYADLERRQLRRPGRARARGRGRHDLPAAAQGEPRAPHAGLVGRAVRHRACARWAAR